MTARVFALTGKRSREVLLDWLAKRNRQDGGEQAAELDQYREHAVEVAPGVWVRLLGHGGFLLPGNDEDMATGFGSVAADGAQIAVWDERGGEFTDWCVWWGGEDPNDCAGRLEYDDEAEASEMTQWVRGGSVASRTVRRSRWRAEAGGAA